MIYQGFHSVPRRSGRGGRRFKSYHSDQSYQGVGGICSEGDKADRLNHRQIPSTDPLKYDPASGTFTWAKPRRGVTVGDEAGSVDKHGYRVIRLDCQIHFAHRLAWLIHYGEWPPLEIDHINRVRTDNRISNLRAVSHAENMANYGTPRTNTSGVRGVSWNKKNQCWEAKATVDGKRQHLGSFATLEEAARAFSLHGEAL